MLKRFALTTVILATALVTEASSLSQPPGDQPVTTNRLADEKSPYLLQHATNPVNWYPWSEEAFKKAKAEDKPIFLSIGYATCHWCHVMEHESFEDPIVAALMNEAFVSIKVDREERPDLDQVYMTVCQMLTGSGGWPLTILMTPDKQPFFAGTYFPRESRYGRIGMLDLVPRVQTMWQSDREKLLESAGQITDHLQKAANQADGGAVPADLADVTYQQLGGRYDPREGGFGDRPKFPSPHNLTFLIEYWQRTSQPKALEMVEKTLEAMRLGGIYDHVGFGFHRYSTDSEWLVPHFEKMLYDQAMLTFAYTETFAATGKPQYERTVREVLSYVLRDMTAPGGGFYSAEDADSEGEEGLFYLWTTDEISEVLSEEDAAFAIDLFNANTEGNYLDESTHKATGENILHLQETHDEAAKRIGLDRNRFDARQSKVRESLFSHRERRVHPLKDDKVLADWNGLMAAAMARAGRVFDDPTYIAAAKASLQFVLTGMRGTDGRLLHRFRDGEAAISAFLDDYVFLTWACIELYDATLDPRFLVRAVDLVATTIDLFWDEDHGGFFFTSDRSEKLLVRPKEVYDGAMPSGNSVALFNLVRLGRLTGRSEFSDRADAMAKAFSRELRTAPSGHTHMVTAVQRAASPSVEVVIVGESASSATQRLIDTVRAGAPPHTAVVLLPEGDGGALIRQLAPFTEHHTMIDDKPTAYVCRDNACKLPTTDPDQAKELLLDVSQNQP